MKVLSLSLLLSLGLATPVFAAKPARPTDYAQECRPFAELQQGAKEQQQE